ELVDAETRHEERHGETRGVESRQDETAAPTAARRGETEYAAEDRADARRPAGGEREAQSERPQHAARPLVRELARVAIERADLQHAHQLQAEGDDDETADDAYPAVRDDGRADRARRRAEQQKDQR